MNFPSYKKVVLYHNYYIILIPDAEAGGQEDKFMLINDIYQTRDAAGRACMSSDSSKRIYIRI